MNHCITIPEFFEGDHGTLIDVRSPAEFKESSIPGAINLPLFDDQERALIGAVYRHRGDQEARRLGIQLLGPKLSRYIDQFQSLPGPLTVFCWRGGMRSQSVCQLLAMAGIHSRRLQGGYKAYRRYINEFLADKPPRPVVVLDGLTGVGKTEILAALKERGIGAIDLEGLARNRGSVFGALGMGDPPSQKDFEGALAHAMMEYRDKGCYVVECESRRIGRLILPRTFAEAMAEGEHILLYASLESRVQRLVRIYGTRSFHALAGPLEMLAGRLGRDRVEQLKDMLRRGELEELTSILLTDYYDPLYRYPSQPTDSYPVSICTDRLEPAADCLAEYIAQKYRDDSSQKTQGKG